MESVMILRLFWDLCTIDWSAIAAIVSLFMIVLTAISLLQSKKQLNEMKRQWKEQNTPVVSCSLAKCNDFVILEVFNSSQVPAHRVKIEIVNNTGEKIFHFEETDALLKEMTFEIPPQMIKQIPIWITPYVDGDYKCYITGKVTCETKTEEFYLYLKEINLTTWQYSNKEICKSIDNVCNEIRK